jgi:tetratricopeptide (TPR) repeat protein
MRDVITYGYRILPALVFVGLITCKPEEHVFFMRYEPVNRLELEKDIAIKLSELKQTTDDHELFMKSVDLSESLTVCEREDEAIKLLQPYIENDNLKEGDEDLAWLYLNYATANQYAGKNHSAEKYFQKALTVSEAQAIEPVAHYIFHHYGRFLVEQKRYDDARQYFTKALSLRQKLNDKRVVSSQKALDTLDLIIQRHQF